MLARLLQIATAIASGGVPGRDLARALVGLAVETGVPANELASYLTQESVLRAERLADVAQAAKRASR